jgi:protocatechuate 3,4-dioxygenase beta subunit
VQIWHTDASGRYGPAGTDDCCYYGGTVRADGNGRFRLDTIRPGQYPQPGAPRAHIHFDIAHPSGRLATEIQFFEPGKAPVADPGHGIVPVTLQPVGPDQAGQRWYGEATLVLEA